jgi:hypothetical protein
MHTIHMEFEPRMRDGGMRADKTTGTLVSSNFDRNYHRQCCLVIGVRLYIWWMMNLLGTAGVGPELVVTSVEFT